MNVVPQVVEQKASSKPLISVAMPVYNGESHLVEAIDSILSQKFTNFEFIIIDDGSTDNSLKILREYQQRYARIRLIARENRNLATTLNDIIDLARGKWIARMDQDDIALPNRFERQVVWLNQTGADICGTWVEFFGTSDRRILKHPVSDSAIKTALFFGSVFAHPSVMMRATLAKQLRYSQEWEKCEDYDLWQRAAYANWKMTNLPEVLLRYRQHKNQISTASLCVQQELTQKIRLRHWEMMRSKLGVDEAWITELLKLRQPIPPDVDLHTVNLALIALGKSSDSHESLEVVLDHAGRLYARAAGRSHSLMKHWIRLNTQLGVKTSARSFLQLLFLRIFRLGPENPFFARFKAISLGRWR